MIYTNSQKSQENGFGGLNRYDGKVQESEGINADKNTKIFVVALDGTELFQNIEGEVIGCNDKLFAIDLEKLVSPRDALVKLFDYAGDDSVYNVFEQNPIMIDSFDIVGGKAIVYLSANGLGGGMCDSPRISAQLNKTLLQFNEIKEIEIYFNDEPLENYLSEKD